MFILYSWKLQPYSITTRHFAFDIDLPKAYKVTFLEPLQCIKALVGHKELSDLEFGLFLLQSPMDLEKKRKASH